MVLRVFLLALPAHHRTGSHSVKGAGLAAVGANPAPLCGYALDIVLDSVLDLRCGASRKKVSLIQSTMKASELGEVDRLAWAQGRRIYLHL
jgi:hypothetical protein